MEITRWAQEDMRYLAYMRIITVPRTKRLGVVILWMCFKPSEKCRNCWKFCLKKTIKLISVIGIHLTFRFLSKFPAQTSIDGFFPFLVKHVSLYNEIIIIITPYKNLRSHLITIFTYLRGKSVTWHHHTCVQIPLSNSFGASSSHCRSQGSGLAHQRSDCK